MTLAPGPQETSRLFGLDLWCPGLPEAVERLDAVVRSGVRPARVVVTPNVDHVVLLDREPDLVDLYRQADFFLPDGWPLVAASLVLGERPIRERAAGSDLVPRLCGRLAARAGTIHVVGGPPGQEAATDRALRERFPGLRVGSEAPPFQVDLEQEAGEEVAGRVAAASPDLVLVCLGFPKQERFALRHRDRLGAPLVVCCGATLDFLVGRQRRAPYLVRRAGLEWLWRLAWEPRRLWRRYLLRDPFFLWLLLREWWRPPDRAPSR